MCSQQPQAVKGTCGSSYLMFITVYNNSMSSCHTQIYSLSIQIRKTNTALKKSTGKAEHESPQLRLLQEPYHSQTALLYTYVAKLSCCGNRKLETLNETLFTFEVFVFPVRQGMNLKSLVSLSTKCKFISVTSEEQIITQELYFGSHFLTHQENLFPQRQC